jgi:hypothetical protein
MSTVRELQAELKKRGLDTTGKKAELVKRLEEAKAEDFEDEEPAEKADDNKQGEPEPEDDRTWTRAVKFFKDCKAQKADIVPLGPKWSGEISWLGQAVPTAIQVHCCECR